MFTSAKYKHMVITLALLMLTGLPLPAFGETAAAPGRLLGPPGPGFEKSLAEAWAHRSLTYEIYHQDSKRLASLAYALARHSGDIDGAMSPERFVAGVKGFHYQVSQVGDWLNDLAAGKSADPTLVLRPQ